MAIKKVFFKNCKRNQKKFRYGFSTWAKIKHVVELGQ